MDWAGPHKPIAATWSPPPNPAHLITINHAPSLTRNLPPAFPQRRSPSPAHTHSIPAPSLQSHQSKSFFPVRPLPLELSPPRPHSLTSPLGPAHHRIGPAPRPRPAAPFPPPLSAAATAAVSPPQNGGSALHSLRPSPFPAFLLVGSDATPTIRGAHWFAAQRAGAEAVGLNEWAGRGERAVSLLAERREGAL